MFPPTESKISIASLTYYPIKACRGFEVDSAKVQRMGLEHDRRMMVVTAEGRFLTQREYPRLALVTPKLERGTLELSAPGYDCIQVGIQTRGTPVDVSVWRSKGVKAIDQGEEAAGWFSDWLGAPVRKNLLPITVPGVNGAEVAISGLKPVSAVLPPPEAR